MHMIGKRYHDIKFPKMFVIRLTVKQLDVLRRKAQKNGVSMAEFIRQMIDK